MCAFLLGLNMAEGIMTKEQGVKVKGLHGAFHPQIKAYSGTGWDQETPHPEKQKAHKPYPLAGGLGRPANL